MTSSTAPDGALAGAGAGAVLVDHTTASADIARELAEACAEFGRRLRRRAGVRRAGRRGGGTLTVMCGTDDEGYYERGRAGDGRLRQGVGVDGPGGQRADHQDGQPDLIAGIVQGLAEGLNFAVRAGLDPDAVVDVIRHGAAQSWQMENRASTMVRGEFDFGFAVEWMRKDLGIALREAARNGARGADHRADRPVLRPGRSPAAAAAGTPAASSTC